MPRIPDGGDNVEVTPNDYIAIVDDVDEKTYEKDGTPLWLVRFKIIDDCDSKDGCVWDRLYFNKKMGWKTRQVLAAMGVDVDSVDEVEADDITGKLLRIDVIENNGYNNINWKDSAALEGDELKHYQKIVDDHSNEFGNDDDSPL